MHREAAAKRPGVLTKVGMDTFVDPGARRLRDERQGGGRADRQPRPFRRRRMAVLPDHRARQSRSSAPPPPTSAAISPTSTKAAFSGRSIRRSRVRNNGGLVIAQVKRLAAAGTLRPHDVIVPGILVDVIVVAPDQLQTTHTPYEPAISGEIFRPLSSFETPKFDVAKVIARRVAQELRDGDAVNIGFGISANVPRILIEEGRHGAVTWVIEQGAVGGVPLLDFQFGCASNAEAIVQSPQQFTYFQGGGFDMSLLSFLQIDRDGSVNVSKLGVRPHVTAGAAASSTSPRGRRRSCSPAISPPAPRLEVHDGALAIVKEGKVKKLVEAVEQVSFSGPRAVAQGQEIRLCHRALRDAARTARA